MYGFGKPSSIWAAVPALASSLILHTFVFMILLAVSERLMLPNSSELSKHPANAYALYNNMAWNFQAYSLQRFVSGSPLCNLIVMVLGGQLESHTILFGRIYEFSKFSAAARTIADSCHTTSHYVVFNEVTIGHCRVSGVLHNFTYVSNATLTSTMSGPMRAYIGDTKYQDSTDEGQSLELDYDINLNMGIDQREPQDLNDIENGCTDDNKDGDDDFEDDVMISTNLA